MNKGPAWIKEIENGLKTVQPSAEPGQLGKNISGPKVLIAMPAFNEARYIGSLVLKARLYAEEILVVDDGSRDNTTEIAALAGAAVIRHKTNRGKGAAIQTIFAEARKIKPDILVLLDADSQHSPQDIPQLLEPISRGADIVIGSRVEKQRNIPSYRRAGQRVLSFCSRTLSGKKIYDSESGFRALSARAIAELNLNQNGFAIETEMISAAAEKRLTIVEVPIAACYTKDGSTLNPVRHGIGVLINILGMISERKPLFFFGIGGLIGIILGLIAGIRTLSVMSHFGAVPIGTAVLSALLLIVGVFSIFTGFILYSLAKHRNNGKNSATS